jgi:hypothetical protein
MDFGRSCVVIGRVGDTPAVDRACNPQCLCRTRLESASVSFSQVVVGAKGGSGQSYRLVKGKQKSGKSVAIEWFGDLTDPLSFFPQTLTKIEKLAMMGCRLIFKN